MEFEKLIYLVQDQPVFESSVLLSGDIDPNYLRKQISLWVNANKITQLKRGLYTLAPPYQKVKPHPFLIANRMQPGSYVSYQSALAHYGLIPEYVPVILSATTNRPRSWENSFGVFEYHHIKTSWFNSYNLVALTDNQFAYIAIAEKALLDLVLLTPQGDSLAYIRELRLQNLETLDLSTMKEIVQMSGKPKLTRLFTSLKHIIANDGQEYRKI